MLLSLGHREVTRSDCKKTPAPAKPRAEMKRGVAGMEQATEGTTSNPEFPLSSCSRQPAHPRVSPSQATGKTYWFELLPMGIKSELILLAWRRQPSPYTQAGTASTSSCGAGDAQGLREVASGDRVTSGRLSAGSGLWEEGEQQSKAQHTCTCSFLSLYLTHRLCLLLETQHLAAWRGVREAGFRSAVRPHYRQEGD